MIRVVFLGMRCAASVPPLAALLAGGCDVSAVVVPAPPAPQSWGETIRRAPPRIGGPGGHEIDRLAAAAGVPVIGVSRAGEEMVAVVAGERPEAVVVACFPWRLPAALLALPPLGCLNVHPALLPRGRGPAPVFWTLRRGERRTGATVHAMDAGFDSGPIVAQEGIDVPAGVRAPELEARLMALGGRLLVEALPKLAAGTVKPVPQDDALATPAPTPTAADFAMPTNLPAGWAYGFARGVAPLGGPLAVHVGATGERLPVGDALAYAADERMAEPVVAEGEGVVRVRFRPGWVRFRV